MLDDRLVCVRIVVGDELGFGVVGASVGEGGVHCFAGRSEGGGLGFGAMVLEVLFAAAGKSELGGCSEGLVSAMCLYWKYLWGRSAREDLYWERVLRKRKSWGSSVRSVSVASGAVLKVVSSSRSAIVLLCALVTLLSTTSSDLGALEPSSDLIDFPKASRTLDNSDMCRGIFSSTISHHKYLDGDRSSMRDGVGIQIGCFSKTVENRLHIHVMSCL